MKKLLFVLVGIAGTAVVFAEATISNVTLRQRWPWGREVDVYYTLTGASSPIAVRPTFTVGGEPLAVADSALGGDRVGLVSGLHHLVWTPSDTDFADRAKLLDVRVALTPAPMPLYAIYDLTDAGKPKNPTYVFEDDLRAGKWGTWQENPYDYINSVIWTGVNADIAYKTDKLVLRYVHPTTDPMWVAHAGVDTYLMGTPADTPNGEGGMSDGTMVYNVPDCSPQQTVKLTKGFWLGVFELTQQQYAHVTGLWPSWFRNEAYRATRPVESVPFSTMRGSVAAGFNWPIDGHKVAADSCLGKLRARTGATFDLPTEAQWEYACRAGSTGVRYGEIKEVGRSWFQSWGGYDSPDAGTGSGTAAVGTYKPNAWGFYDMLGNVSEFCLNAKSTYAVAAVAGTDPVGDRVTGDEKAKRVIRGGEYYNYIGMSTAPCRRFSEGSAAKLYQSSYYGFRVCLPID